MSKIELNKDLRLSISDYDETEQADIINQLRDDDLTPWYGYGELAGLRARATYLTTPGDEHQVEEVGGDWGSIDWMERLHHVDIITDDHVPVVTVYNLRYSDSDDKYEAANTPRKYKSGDEDFDRVFVNSLNGIDPTTLTAYEIEVQEQWVNENWEDLNTGTQE